MNDSTYPYAFDRAEHVRRSDPAMVSRVTHIVDRACAVVVFTIYVRDGRACRTFTLYAN